MMIRNIYNMDAVTFVNKFLGNKAYGNGFYDFGLIEIDYRAHMLWQSVVEITERENFDMLRLEDIQELVEALNDFVDTIYSLSLSRWWHRVHNLHFIGYPDSRWSTRETEFINERAGKWFKDMNVEFLPHAPLIDYVPIVVKKQQKRFNHMDKDVLDDVRKRVAEHTGIEQPTILVCVDAGDARVQETRRTLTFREVYKTGIHNLRNRIELSQKANEVLYDQNR